MADYFNGAIAVIAAFSAIVIYFFKIRAMKIDAASQVISDMKRAEKIIIELRSRLDHEPGQQMILLNPNWQSLRHILRRDLGRQNVFLIDQFFDNCRDIDIANNSMNELFIENTKSKIHVLQNFALQARATDTPNEVADRREIIQFLENIGYTFRLRHPLEIVKGISTAVDFASLIPAYRILRSISNRRWS